MTKARITAIAMYNASNLSGRDVAKVARNKRRITLRHVWRTGADGRVLDGISRAVRTLAQELADDTGHSVAVYAKEGYQINEVEPR